MRYVQTLLIVVALLVIPPFAHTESYVAYVLDCKGSWFLEGRPGKSLRIGERLPAGGVIRNQSPETDDFLIVVALNGSLIQDVSCTPPKNCWTSIVLPSNSDVKENAFGIVLHAAMELIFGAPSRYSVHRARDNPDTLSEAILPIEKGQVDISDAFKSMASGSYRVSFRYLGSKRVQSSVANLKLVVNWIRAKETKLLNRQLRPGLWEIQAISEAENPYVATPHIAWVLLVDKRAYNSKRKEFREAVTGTEIWPRSVTPETKTQILRAYLDNLASTLSP